VRGKRKKEPYAQDEISIKQRILAHMGYTAIYEILSAEDNARNLEGPGSLNGESEKATKGTFSRRRKLAASDRFSESGEGSGVSRRSGRLHGSGLLTLINGANG
jgi:hypothetical protein